MDGAKRPAAEPRRSRRRRDRGASPRRQQRARKACAPTTHVPPRCAELCCATSPPHARRRLPGLQGTRDTATACRLVATPAPLLGLRGSSRGHAAHTAYNHCPTSTARAVLQSPSMRRREMMRNHRPVPTVTVMWLEPGLEPGPWDGDNTFLTDPSSTAATASLVLPYAAVCCRMLARCAGLQGSRQQSHDFTAFVTPWPGPPSFTAAEQTPRAAPGAASGGACGARGARQWPQPRRPTCE